MHFFEHVELAPPDAILGLSLSFAADPRENKVNLGAGVFKTEDLKPFILKSVKEAEARILGKEKSKDYLPIDGLAAYLHCTENLVFNKTAPAERIYGAQTVGGTAALRVGGRFLAELGLRKIYLSSPTWANHHRIFHHAGLVCETYPYFSAKKKGFDFQHFLKALDQMEPRSVVLLQTCCHNPTGFDPTQEEWVEICEVIEVKKLFPFFDFAYQGFGSGIAEDTHPLIPFLQKGLECFIAVSHAKNFGLYAERCGLLFAVCREASEVKKIGSRLKVIIRGMYSNPPCHGARIVAEILHDEALSTLWKQEVAQMRARITNMRQALALGLKQHSSAFDFLEKQKGMFSYTGLSEAQVEKLISDYAIYLPKDGRINVAGLNQDNLDYVIKAIVAVSH